MKVMVNKCDECGWITEDDARFASHAQYHAAKKALDVSFPSVEIRALLFNEMPYMEWVMKNTGLELDQPASAKMEELQETAQGEGGHL